MNYQKHYDALIERAKSRTLTGYVERHHIVPKCLGGTNDVENIVVLTAEEHFVAHQLLVKLYPGNAKIAFAAFMMCITPNGGRKNKLYGWLKRNMSVASSVRSKGVVWTEEQNKARSIAIKAQWSDPDFKAKRSASMRGRRWSDESRLAKSEALKGKPGRVWTAEQKQKLSASKRIKQLLKGADSNEY